MSVNRKDTDQQRLQKTLEKVLAWGPVSEWHSSMFDELSELVFEKCQVMLSPITLKRFFGVVNYNGTPSITTLDALSRFTGQKNWRSFKISGTPSKKTVKWSSAKKSRYGTIGFFLALVTMMIISNTQQEQLVALDDITFSSRPVTNSYPNSVVFDLDLGESSFDHIVLQQYWDDTKTITLENGQTQATGIYYFPGYFRAKLIGDGNLLKEHELFLKSNRWLGMIEYEPVPSYFIPQRSDEIALSYPPELLDQIKRSDSPLMTGYHYIDDLGSISADNFELTSRVKNTYNDKWAVCGSAKIYIIGSKGAMIIPVAKCGCSSDNNLMLNDVFLSGKEHDLTAFSANLSQVTDMEIAVSQQHFTLSIDGQVAYAADYKKPMGKLVGIRYKFLGLGEVHSFVLTDQDKHQVVLD